MRHSCPRSTHRLHPCLTDVRFRTCGGGGTSGVDHAGEVSLTRVPAYRAAMEWKDVQRLKQEWAAKGSPPCDHLDIVKEVIDGIKTGDKVCTTCGQNFVNGKPVG